MNNETFRFKVNGAERQGRHTMADMIDFCREKAISGRILDLWVMSSSGWVKLASYGPDTCSPIITIDKYTKKEIPVEVCTVDINLTPEQSIIL